MPRLNNQERQLWVDNDETLYRWRKAERLSVTAFIKAYKIEIDQYITHKLNFPKREY